MLSELAVVASVVLVLVAVAIIVPRLVCWRYGHLYEKTIQTALLHDREYLQQPTQSYRCERCGSTRHELLGPVDTTEDDVR